MQALQRLIILLLVALAIPVQQTKGQELLAKVNVNHKKIQGTDDGIFNNLQEALTQFINERQWTNLQFKRNERINCTFNITVDKYDMGSHLFNCTLLIQCTRPVFNSTYTTTSFGMTDGSFNFEYQEYDKLEFRPDVIDNDLTALVGYYVYLIIGTDLDTMSPLGGTEYLQTAQVITNNAQGLTASAKGWKAFDDTKNRYAIINDLLDGGMETYRQMLYQYHREGLDVMAENPERGRTGITEALAKLEQAHKDKPLSMVPQLFTEYKRDEIVNIYKGKANSKEKESIPEILSKINASMNSYWRQIRQ